VTGLFRWPAGFFSPAGQNRRPMGWRRSAAVTVLCFAAVAGAQETAPQPQPAFDLLLVGGKVADGRGGPLVDADVGVRGDRIVAIGDLRQETAGRTIGARGLVVAPGFIDLHAHADAVARSRGDAANFVRMGVTSIVTGNCGSSVSDLAAHFRQVAAAGISVNYGSLIGHGTVRQAVMKLASRAPTEAELSAMGALVERAMLDGAFGMSTGLIYVPGTYARTPELIELARVVAPHGGVYASHIRNENNDVLEAIDEALAIGTTAKLPVHVSHLKASGRSNHGRSAEILDKLRGARRNGQPVTADQYLYPASSTGLEVLFPSAELEQGRAELARKIAGDPGERARLKSALHATREAVGFADFSYCRVANAPGQDELDGLTIDRIAEQRRGSRDADAQAETILDLFVAADGARVQMIYHSMAEPDVERFVAEDWIAVASDAGIFADSGDRPHPRGAGNNPRLLGRYVREQRRLELAVAVRKMTELPARTFGIPQRGRIEVGWFADLVLFDPERVADRATFDEPRQAPDGIPFVIVNGIVVIDAGRHTGERPGRILRPKR
jgi:N-acyl-D-amino-acid deacylase